MAHPGVRLASSAGALACLLVGAVAVGLLLRGPALPALHAAGWAVGAAAVVGLGAGLALGRSEAVPGAVALTAAVYALVLLDAPRAAAAATAAAPLVAGALFLAAELGWWSTELRRGAREAPGALLRRGALLGAAAAGAVVLAEACLVAGGVRMSAGWISTAIGVAAASTLLGMAAWLAARGGGAQT